MGKKDLELDLVKNFIYNDSISKSIDDINQNFLDFNILEITGMGTQEIKHSHILEWILGDNQHNLKYKVFIELLKEIYHDNDLNDDELQKYIYLTQERNIKIHREMDNIDLVIEDTLNKKVFVIENKVFAEERTDGSDGGQLQKYENIISEKYPQNKKDKYDVYFIFLTPDSKDASRDNWHTASYKMIADILNKILKTTQLQDNTKLVINSYLDLLKRKHIVGNEELEKLCENIWNNQEYKSALEILYSYKPDRLPLISKYLQDNIPSYNLTKMDSCSRRFIRFSDSRFESKSQNEGKGWTKSNKILLYEFQNSSNGLFLKFIMGPSTNTTFRETVFHSLSKSQFFDPGKTLSAKWNQLWSSEVIITQEELSNSSIDEIENKLKEWMEVFFSQNEGFEKIHSHIYPLIQE